MIKNHFAFIFLSVILFVTAGCVNVQAQTTPTTPFSSTATLTATITATVTPTATATFTPTPTATATLNPFDAFVKECEGPGVDISCIYVEGILAIHLERGDGNNIPYQKGTARVWDQAWKDQVIGIIAHDGADGQKFYQLYGNKIIYLIWTNGKVERYGINAQEAWRNVSDNLSDWEWFSPWDGGTKVSSEYLVNHYYRGGINFNKMVLQTCIGGNAGVVFVVAYRLGEIK